MSVLKTKMKRGVTNEVRNAAMSGFSLIEVLVALVIISIGLLGIAKMHALTYANTSGARYRSLAALEGSSLAATMHANREFWAKSAPTSLTVVTTTTTTTFTTTPTDSAWATAQDCTAAAACSAKQVAAYDMQQWAASLRSLLPNAGLTMTCQTVKPINCDVRITWDEKTVTSDKAANAQATTPSTFFQMFVEP